MFEGLKTAVAEYAAQRQALIEKLEPLQESLNALFEKYPEVQWLGWSQYTPYFSDGDSCTFGVNDLAVATKADIAKLREDEGLDEEDEIDFYDHYDDLIYSEVDWPAGLKDDARALSQAIDGVGDFLQAIFGDGVLVSVTREGIETHVWTHD